MNDKNEMPSTENSGYIESGNGEMSLIAKIAGIFLEPGKTFRNLSRSPNFIAPLVIVMLASLLFTIFALPIIVKSSLEMQREKLEELDTPQEQIDQQLEIAKKFIKPFALVAAPISTVVIALIITGIMLFAGNIVMGGESKYKMMLSLYCYSDLVDVIAFAVRLPLVLNKGTMEVYISLAALMPEAMKETIWFKIAAVFDIFVIWKLILISVGMGIVYKTKTHKPLLIMVLIYLLFAGISIAVSGI